MPETLAAVLKLWPILVVLASIFSSWALWSAKKQFVSKDEAVKQDEKHIALLNQRSELFGGKLDCLRDKTDHRMDVMEKDIAVIHSRLEGLPTKDDMHRIEIAVGKVGGEFQARAASQEASLKALERNMHLLLKCQMEPES